MTWLHDQNFLNLFETDLINFHSKSVFLDIFLEQEISQDQ